MKKLKAFDGKTIYYQNWLPAGRPQAIVQIVHGMAEHSGSYQELAEYFVKRDIAVFCHDQRGHGHTAGSKEDYGYLADQDGWQLLLSDIHQLTDVIKSAYFDLPIYLYGHSMGSILVQGYIRRWGADIEGVLMSGMPVQSSLLQKIGCWIAKKEMQKCGARHRSKRLSALSFGKYNRKFHKPETAYDWLSRDKEKVAAYIADPWCGGTFSSGFFADMLGGILDLQKSAGMKDIPHNLAFLFFTGERDATNSNGKRIWEVINFYERHGFYDLEAIFYPDCRHDLKLELNREMIFADMLTWLDSKIRIWKKHR
ncbi:MAG: lysophospholipase [Candidatus Cloacimonetes bacterium]|nr:lysophospholipase [Candidatus Cloacimonadota bacterium]